MHVAAKALVDPNEFVLSGKADLVPSLSRPEKKAVALFVNFLPDLISVDPLFTYAVGEVLDGRIQVGDGYSWLPKHEVDAVVDFIDFLVDERGSMLSESEAGSLLAQRSSRKFWRAV